MLMKEKSNNTSTQKTHIFRGHDMVYKNVHTALQALNFLESKEVRNEFNRLPL